MLKLAFSNADRDELNEAQNDGDEFSLDPVNNSRRKARCQELVDISAAVAETVS